MKWVDKCKEETKLTVRPDYTKSADEIPENAKACSREIPDILLLSLIQPNLPM